MKRNNISVLVSCSLLLLLGVVVLVGCTSSNATGVSDAGKKVLLDAEPADATNVIDMKSGIRVGSIAMDGTAVICGKVLSGQDWEPTQAAFVIRDLVRDSEAAGHDHAHGDDSECAFCQANKKKDVESLAMVQIVDDAGAVLEMDARKLLGLSENDVVVAQGMGELADDGTLVFSAKKVFIRK